MQYAYLFKKKKKKSVIFFTLLPSLQLKYKYGERKYLCARNTHGKQNMCSTQWEPEVRGPVNRVSKRSLICLGLL